MYVSKLLIHRNPRAVRVRQQGAALVVGLIMLLLLTLIGVAGMRDTLLQEKMAGNMRDREMALQAAEAALRAGEAELMKLDEPVFNGSGRYDTAKTTATAREDKNGNNVSEAFFWATVWGDDKWDDGNSVLYPNALPGVKDKPRYVIERLNPNMTDRSKYSPITSEGYVASAALEEVTTVDTPDYRVTARGTGMTDDAEVIVQSTYRREQ